MLDAQCFGTVMKVWIGFSAKLEYLFWIAYKLMESVSFLSERNANPMKEFFWQKKWDILVTISSG